MRHQRVRLHLNEDLASDRAGSAAKAMANELKRSKIATNDAFYNEVS